MKSDGVLWSSINNQQHLNDRKHLNHSGLVCSYCVCERWTFYNNLKTKTLFLEQELQQPRSSCPLVQIQIDSDISPSGRHVKDQTEQSLCLSENSLLLPQQTYLNRETQQLQTNRYWRSWICSAAQNHIWCILNEAAARSPLMHFLFFLHCTYNKLIIMT